MAATEDIHRAIWALGEQKADDYILSPSGHADLLEAHAPVLASLLRGANMAHLAETYARLDREAGEAQARFKRSMSSANLSVLAAGALSGATLVVGVLHAVLGEDIMHASLLVCGIGALICGGLAAAFIFQVREGRLLEAWMTRRSDAEMARFDYFNEFMRAECDCPSDPPLLLLKLEYFRRFQLDVQLAYYRERGRQHAASARKTLLLGSLAAGAGAMSAGAAGVLGLAAVALTALGGLGVLGTTLAAFASAREAMNQDRRNSERYARTLGSLEKLKGKLGDVREAAASGGTAVIEEFYAAVHEQLSLEHRQWRESGESLKSAVAQLERTLDDFRNAQKPSG